MVAGGSADGGPAGGETLVAGVLGLAEEGLEAAEPVGRPVAGVGHLELEVLAEMAQAPEHGGQAEARRPGGRVQLADLDRPARPGEGRGQLGDLPGGQEIGPGAEHAEHRIVHVRALARGGGVRRTRVLERAADGRTYRLRDRRRERVADLPVARGLAATEPPAPVVLPAL